MVQNNTQPVPEAVADRQQSQGKKQRKGNTVNDPLSGSKKVKNRNHSRDNHGEGH